MTKTEGYFVTTNGMINRELPNGWYVVKYWEPVAGPFPTNEEAAREMARLQNQ